MEWYWWALIIYAGLWIFSKLAVNMLEGNSILRHIVSIGISIAYPIIALCNQDDSILIVVIGAFALGLFKYVFNPAVWEGDGPSDFLVDIALSFTSNEDGVILILMILLAAIFGVLMLLPTLLFIWLEWEFLITISLFFPAAYCIITAVMASRDDY